MSFLTQKPFVTFMFRLLLKKLTPELISDPKRNTNCSIDRVEPLSFRKLLILLLTLFNFSTVKIYIF